MPAMTEERAETLRKAEPDFLKSLIDAAEDDDTLDPEMETAPIFIPPLRKRPAIEFLVHGLSSADYRKLGEANTPRVPNADLGIKVAGDLNEEGYWADIIVAATEKEDGERLWHNADLLRAYGCRTSKELVQKLIPKTGWRQDVVRTIDALSGTAPGQRLLSRAEWEQQQAEKVAHALGN